MDVSICSEYESIILIGFFITVVFLFLIIVSVLIFIRVLVIASMYSRSIFFTMSVAMMPMMSPMMMLRALLQSLSPGGNLLLLLLP